MISKTGGPACTCVCLDTGGAGTGDRGRRSATSLAFEMTVHRTPYGGTDAAVPEH